MQVTGSNRGASIRYGLSIRPQPDGQSFSLTEATYLHGGEEIVEVVLDTPRQLLLPANQQLSAAEALKRCGVEVDESEEVVEERVGNGWLLIAIVPRNALGELSRRNPSHSFRYHSPLVDVARQAVAQERDCYLIHFTEHNLYIGVAHGGAMLYIAALPARTTAELLYAVEAVRRDYPLAGAPTLLSGERAKSVKREMKQYFKGIKVCG